MIPESIPRTDGKPDWKCYRRVQGVQYSLDMWERALIWNAAAVETDGEPTPFDTYKDVLCGWRHTDDVAQDGSFTSPVVHEALQIVVNYQILCSA